MSSKTIVSKGERGVVQFLNSAYGGALTDLAVVDDASGDLSLLDINGNTIMSLNYATGVLSINGQATIGTTGTNLSLSGTLGVTGATTLSSTLAANGNVTLGANKNLSAAAGTGAVDMSQATGTFKPSSGLFTFQGKVSAATAVYTIADPGAAGAIAVTSDGVCDLTSAGAETRTLAAPTYNGQEILINMNVKVGNITLTVAANFDGTNNTVVFSAAGQAVKLQARKIAGVLTWALITNLGAALSHV